MNDIRRSRLTLVMVAALFAAPLVVAWLLHASGFQVSATVNHGDLVAPARPLGELPVEPLAAGGPPAAGPLLGSWVMVYLQRGACEAACRRALYVMRQVRLAQGRNIQRVRRVLLWAGEPPAEAVQALAGHYPGLLQARPADARLLGQFALTAGEDPVASGRIYLIDPHGNLMMSYEPGAEPKGMIKDLERLLKHG